MTRDGQTQFNSFHKDHFYQSSVGLHSPIQYLSLHITSENSLSCPDQICLAWTPVAVFSSKMHAFNKKYLRIQGLNFTLRRCSGRFHFERWSKAMALSLSCAPAPHRWWVYTQNKVLTFHYCHKVSCRTTLSSFVLIKNVSSGSWKKRKKKTPLHRWLMNLQI